MKPNSNCFSLRPATCKEASLFYLDDQADRSLGTVGHVRMDFGSSGKGFYHTWWPHNGEQFNTPEFKEALQQFVTIWSMTCMGRRTPGRWRITCLARGRRWEGSRCDHTE